MVHLTEVRIPSRIYRPLIPMTIAWAVGITLGAWRPGLWWWSLGAILATGVFLGVQLLNRREAFISPILLCALVGYLSIQPWLGRAPSRDHIFRFADQGYWIIHGEVAGRPSLDNGRWRFLLEAERLKNKQQSVAVHGLVRVSGRGEWPGARPGDRVVFRGRLRTIRSFTNPGGFDYERHMRLKGIRTKVYAAARSLKIESTAPYRGIPGQIQSLGDTLALQMDGALNRRDPDALRLLKTLILGRRDQITPDFREKFNRTGVGHVLAISGLHVGMVATVSFVAATWLLAMVPAVVERAWVRRGAALVSLGPIMIYGVLAGLSPSTQRAMLMVSVILLGYWVGRRHDWLNSLALAAWVILILDPPALLTVSFQLSFAAVSAILAGCAVWPGRRETVPAGIGHKLRRRFLLFVWVSALAILGTLPLVLHYFNQVSMVGLATNLIVVPLVGLVIVPAGLLGAVTLFVHPALGHFFWHPAAWGAELVCRMVHQVSAWPWASVQWITPSPVEIVLYYLLCALILFWRRLPLRVAAAVVLLSLWGADIGYWTYQRYGRTDLRVTALDIGQASANLVEFPGGYTMLFDGGGFSDNSIFDMGARVLAPILWRKKIKTVDLVVLSHANSDHLNGLFYIIEHFNVAEAWSNHEPAPTKGYRRWIELLDRQNVRHTPFDRLPRQTVRKGVQLELLSPPRGFRDRFSGEGDRDLNADSIVMRVSYDEVSFLFPGDITKPAESDLLKRMGTQRLCSTVLVVPHHGSRTSSSKAFLSAVAPEEAVISAGWQNRFKFPHKEVMRRLKSEGCRIWCTATTGAVEVTTDGKRYAIRAYRVTTYSK
jgi:competence protein ComEC